MRVWYVLGCNTKWFLSGALLKVTVKAEENTCGSALHTSALPSACSPAHAHTHLTPSYLPSLHKEAAVCPQIEPVLEGLAFPHGLRSQAGAAAQSREQ